MTLLPIVARELAVAARRPGTYRMRAYGVLIAMIVAAVVSQSNVPKGLLGHVVMGPCWLVIFLLIFSFPTFNSQFGAATVFGLSFIGGWAVNIISISSARSQLNHRLRDAAANNS